MASGTNAQIYREAVSGAQRARVGLATNACWLEKKQRFLIGAPYGPTGGFSNPHESLEWMPCLCAFRLAKLTFFFIHRFHGCMCMVAT
jgi:hypothetical protein